jgi:Ca2+-binding EF-hand superfamily protein
MCGARLCELVFLLEREREREGERAESFGKEEEEKKRRSPELMRPLGGCRALGLDVPRSQIAEIATTLDPGDSGYVTYSAFVAYAALHLYHAERDAAQDFEEVEEAYNLFTLRGAGPITVAHLRRVAKELKMEVSEDVLKDMIVEANGEPRREGWRKGVDIEDFEEVLRRAGVFQ